MGILFKTTNTYTLALLLLMSEIAWCASSTQAALSPLTPAAQEPIYFGARLCDNPAFECIIIQAHETWESKFSNEIHRDLVQRLNRTYNRLIPGQRLVVPKNLATVTLMELAPFTHQIADKEKQIIVDQDKLAWGAYNADGQLVNWGPIASGRDKCPDSANSCRTLTGIYRVFSKEGLNCKSDIFPIGRGGAKMPYCMYFHKGFALHGSDDIPGFRASHGCIRLFTRDAKWLNDEFVESFSERNDRPGTKVVVRPVSAPSTYRR
jgi:hypothetical protein